jgi:hypothetical protein
MVEDLYRMAWEQVARHFHVPTRQWAGPHSRCYRTLLDKEVLALIQRATDGRVDFGVNRPGLDDSRLPLPCPRDLESYFVTLPEARLEVQTFLKTNPPVVGSTFLDPLFTLGSVSRGDLWNQRRALLAYWGSAEQPAYLHLRFLHDDYDFTAAQFFSTQRGGTLLAGVDLAIDGGDTHPSLDRIKNATIKARDLRLRFELGGAAAGAPVPTLKKLSAPVKVVFGDLTLEIAVPLARFSDQLPHWEISRAPGKTCLDVVLYQGAERSFDLNRLQEAVIGFALRLSSTKAITSKLNPHASIEKGLATISLGDLRLCVPVKPAAIAELQQAVRSGPMMQE